MGIRISSLGKDSSFRDDDYLLKDGDTSGTRLISIQNAADDIARKSTVVIKRASNYDEATTITETDYIIKDNTTAPARVSATNAASSFVQLASYPDDTNVEEEDYILKVGADGSTSKVPAVQAGSDLAIFGGQIAGAEMLEEAIARGIVDQAMTNAIQTTVPQAVTQLRVELSEGSAATQIVDGALTAYSQAVAIAETDKFYKRDVDDTETTYVSAEQIFDAGVVVSSRVKNDCQTPDTDSGYVLDARQGRVLNAVKIDKTSIADNLTTDDTTKVLSAKQGKTLQDNKVDITVPSIAVNVNAGATTDDGKLTTALTALGWNSDIVDGLLNFKSWMADVTNALIPAKTIFTPTAGSSYSSYGGCYYEKMGRIVHVHLGLSGLTANTRHTVYNLSQSIRPATAIFAVGQTDSASSTCNIVINSSGSVTVLSQSTYCSADVIFMI